MNVFKTLKTQIKSLSFWQVAFFVFLVFAFLVNALHESYPDEFDNILGGWFIIHGRLPYIDFFTHHGPVPYFLAGLILLFSGQSFVRFRILYAVFLLFILFGIYYLLRKRVGKENLKFFPFFLAFIGIESTYYWMQMLLADNVAALSFLPAYALVLLKSIFNIRFGLIDILLVSLLSALGLYSSLTYTYLFLIINLSALYLYFKTNRPQKVITVGSFLPFVLIATPHLLWFLYLLVSRSFGDYFYQNFIFNAKYYIYNYPRPEGSTFINPFRYAVLIAHWFFANFYTLLIGVKTFDFTFPVNITLAVTDTALFLYLLLKKRYKLALFVLLIFIFTNVRSNPLNSRETDYQAGVYNIISFFNLFFLLPVLYKSLDEKFEVGKKIVFGLLFLLVCVYGFFAIFHLILKFNDKVVSKYMGKAPLIYDRPNVAPIINSITGQDEHVWIGPFSFEELFYTDRRFPSKYHILIKGIALGEKTRLEMMRDFTKNMPTVVYFDKNFYYLGSRVGDYARFFVDFLDKNYTTLLAYREGKARFASALQVNEKLDLDAKLYIRKDAAPRIIQALISKGYAKRVE
jgi:hypothetical protein